VGRGCLYFNFARAVVSAAAYREGKRRGRRSCREGWWVGIKRAEAENGRRNRLNGKDG